MDEKVKAFLENAHKEEMEQRKNENKESPILSIVLTIFACIGIFSCIIGSIFCFNSSNVVIGCAVLFGCLLEILLVMAIGKIYELLVDIHNKIDK